MGSPNEIPDPEDVEYDQYLNWAFTNLVLNVEEDVDEQITPELFHIAIPFSVSNGTPIEKELRDFLKKVNENCSN